MPASSDRPSSGEPPGRARRPIRTEESTPARKRNEQSSSERLRERARKPSPYAVRILATTIALALFAPAAWADGDPEARIAALEARIAELERRLEAVLDAAPAPEVAPQRIDALEQEIRIVGRRLDIKDEEAAATAVPAQPIVAAGEKGFAIQTRDQSYSLKLRGLLHADARDFVDEDGVPANADTFAISRVRPTIEGTLAGIYDFRFTPDFANGRTVIQDAYLDARFDPRAKLRVGKMKTPFGIERLQGASDIRFVTRALPNNLVPNRDIGVQLHGDVLGGALNYQLGWFNGVNDGRSSEDFADVDNNGDKDAAARLFAQPFFNHGNYWLRGLGVGLAATWNDQRGDTVNTNLPAYRTPGQLNFYTYRTGATATIADGERLRLSPQLTYYAGPLGVIGEYVRVKQDVSRTLPAARRAGTLEHDAWQLAATYLVTGEENSYRDVKPRNPFKVGAPGWGAFEVKSRVARLDVDDAAFTGGNASFADPAVAASDALAWSVGLNWYLNRNLKYVLDYERTDFDGGAPGGGDREDEQVVFARFQVAF